MTDPISDDPGKERLRVGRPAIGAQSGGRQTIIAGMQKFMRLNPLTNVQRLQIAEYAEVTPALVSYYFPDKFDLIVCCSSTIISTHIERVNRLLDEPGSLTEKFRSLGHEFIYFNFLSGHALDYYIDAITRRKQAGEIAALSQQYIRLLDFIKELVAKESDRTIDPAFLHSSLWSQCKYLGRQPHLQALGPSDEADAMIRGLSDETFNLFARGCFR